MATQTHTQTLASSNNASLSRRVLLADALSGVLSGVLLLVASGPIDSFLGLNAPLALAIVGGLCLLYAADLTWIATRPVLDHRLLLIPIVLNSVWIIGSYALIISNWQSLTTEGKWAIAIAAEAVFVFAAIQFYAFWRKK